MLQRALIAGRLVPTPPITGGKHAKRERNRCNHRLVYFTSYVKFYRLPVPVSEHDQPVGFGRVAEVSTIRAIATGAVVVHGGTARVCTEI